jgi:phosphoribosylformylglycinamidine cyclo-ligase
MKRSEVISNDAIQAGDVVVGMASFGKSIYETEYNGGMGSNGLTSARHDVFGKDIKSAYPESFDPSVPEALVYSGSYGLTSPSEGTPLDMGKLVLSPTRTYAPVIAALLKEHRSNIHGLVHCSGGAQTKVLHFIDDLHVIKDNLFETPPLFKIIQQESGTDWKEMYKVFNMGHRMEVYLEEKWAGDVISTAADFGIEAQVIGRVSDYKGRKVTVNSQHGNFTYDG